MEKKPSTLDLPPVILAQPFTPRSSSFPDNDEDEYSPPSTPIMTPRTEFDDELPPSYEEAQRSAALPPFLAEASNSSSSSNINTLQIHRLAISDEPEPPLAQPSFTEKAALHNSADGEDTDSATSTPAFTPASTSYAPSDTLEWASSSSSSSHPRNRWDQLARHIEQRSVHFGRQCEGLGRLVEEFGDLVNRHASTWGDDVGRRAGLLSDDVSRRAGVLGSDVGRRAESIAADLVRSLSGGPWNTADQYGGALSARDGGRRGFGGYAARPRSPRCENDYLFGGGGHGWVNENALARGHGHGRRRRHHHGMEPGKTWRDHRDVVETPTSRDSDNEEDISDTEVPDPETVFIAKVKEINERTEALQAEGKRPDFEILQERDKALEKAQKQKEKALWKIERKMLKKQHKEALKAAKSDIMGCTKEQRKELRLERKRMKKERKEGLKACAGEKATLTK